MPWLFIYLFLFLGMWIGFGLVSIPGRDKTPTEYQRKCGGLALASFILAMVCAGALLASYIPPVGGF